MTIHVSLPKELENMVHTQVKSGMYKSASEVVREALRKFFNVSTDRLTDDEVAWIRQNIAPRLEVVKSGKASLVDGDECFSELDKITD